MATGTCGAAYTGVAGFVTRWPWAVTEEDRELQVGSMKGHGGPYCLLENVGIACRVFLVLVRASVSPVLSALFRDGAPTQGLVMFAPG